MQYALFSNSKILFSIKTRGEAGTLNVPGLAGLGAGVEWILSQGVEALHEKEMALTRLFYEKIVHAPDVKIYGSFDETDRAPIVSLNFGDFSLKVPANATLIVSYIGMKTQEIAIKGKNKIDARQKIQIS